MGDTQENESRTNGRWTKAQHENFLLGLELFGKNWKKIQELVNTRTGSQIRSHAQKHFLKTSQPLQDEEKSYHGKCPRESSNSAAVISKQDSNSQEQDSQHSFFLQKIIKASADFSHINFWDCFIDAGKIKTQIQFSATIEKKDSFVAFDNFIDSKQQTSLPYLSPMSEAL